MKRKGRTDKIQRSEHRASVHSLPPEGRSRLLHPRALDALLILANGPLPEETLGARDDDRPTQQAG